MDALLTRDEFRESVFKRDEHKCVVCKREAKDAHHIMERRLFHDGGYYLDNGASLCWDCHLEAEKTSLTPGFIRFCAQITKNILPEHFYDDLIYDKWGNIVNIDGSRTKGELFYDESVQKILKQGGVLELFKTNYIKYPRTHHLPWSEQVCINAKITSLGSSFCPDPEQSFIESNSDYFKQLKAIKDERVLSSTKVFEGKRVIVTEKMDGENTSLYCDYTHARSLDSKNHESRNWVKNFWSQIAHDIPKGFRICGENMYAKHSIEYVLDTYFYGFSVWNEKNICLSWDETLEWFNLLGITSVPILYDGIYDEQKIKDIWKSLSCTKNEGYVVRIADEFSYTNFRKCVGKFVRKNHIQTVKHWMYGQKMEINTLKKED